LGPELRHDLGIQRARRFADRHDPVLVRGFNVAEPDLAQRSAGTDRHRCPLRRGFLKSRATFSDELNGGRSQCCPNSNIRIGELAGSGRCGALTLKFMFFLLAAAVATVSFSIVSDAALTHCSAVPLLQVTGWCGPDPAIAAGHFHPGAN
jgi:hypothetical protein